MHLSKKPRKKPKMTSAAFDQAFERGEGFEALDLNTVTVHAPVQRVNIDIPKQLLHRIDNEANRIGVPRTSIIKLWISEKVNELKSA